MHSEIIKYHVFFFGRSSIMLRNRKEDNFNFFFQSMDELLHLKINATIRLYSPDLDMTIIGAWFVCSVLSPSSWIFFSYTTTEIALPTVWPLSSLQLLSTSIQSMTFSHCSLCYSFTESEKRFLHNKKLHIVRSQWLEDCLERGQRLQEETYSLKPNGLEEFSMEEWWVQLL